MKRTKWMTISRFIPRMNRKKRKVSSPSSEIKGFTGAYMLCELLLCKAALLSNAGREKDAKEAYRQAKVFGSFRGTFEE
jgi:hypothetical protein